MYTYTSKLGSRCFGRKLEKLVRRGKVTQARFLLRDRETKHGKSKWNPAYGILAEEGGCRCAFTNVLVGA